MVTSSRKRRVAEEEEEVASSPVVASKPPASAKKPKKGETALPTAPPAIVDAAEQRRRAIEWAQQVLAPVKKTGGRRQSTGSLPTPVPNIEEAEVVRAPASSKKPKKKEVEKARSPSPPQSPEAPKTAPKRGRKSLMTLAEDVKQASAAKATSAKAAAKATTPVTKTPAPLPTPTQPSLHNNPTPNVVLNPTPPRVDAKCDNEACEVVTTDPPSSGLLGQLAQGSVICAVIALSLTLDMRVGGVALAVAIFISIIRRILSAE